MHGKLIGVWCRTRQNEYFKINHMVSAKVISHSNHPGIQHNIPEALSSAQEWVILVLKNLKYCALYILQCHLLVLLSINWLLYTNTGHSFNRFVFHVCLMVLSKSGPHFLSFSSPRLCLLCPFKMITLPSMLNQEMQQLVYRMHPLSPPLRLVCYTPWIQAQFLSSSCRN